MLYRTGVGVKVTESDQCQDCRENFLGQLECRGAAILEAALQMGFQLEVLYCPHYAPRLGAERKR